ncbi:MAG: cbb3-type cytochrome c oxidase subunit 3 [Desulfurivibrionaceae bacterium]|nr:cbb3-type cytochrome c oxidase subunit 3 [Desulfobulbales bacterium]MDT8334743.1 cbb3-type cytochrome c oxidase subunit 3 [Desulfurivibrionaceae bacterium]
MGLAEILYLGVTFAMLVIFAVIVFRTFRKDRKEKYEKPKYRIFDDDQPKGKGE